MKIANPTQISRTLLAKVRASLPALALPEPAHTPSRFEAAVLQVGLTGTALLVEDLAKNGREGAELFGSTLTAFMSRVLTILESQAGQVARLEGDEILAFFPLNPSETARNCQARAAQAADLINQLRDEDFTPTTHLSYGRIDLLRLGSATTGYELTLAGPLVGQTSGPIQPQMTESKPDFTSEVEEELVNKKVAARLGEWLPPIVWQHLKEEPDFTGSWQRAVVLGVQFEGPDYTDEAGLKHLQEYYSLVQHICTRHSGLLYRFQPGSNGQPHRFTLLFGTLLSDLDDAERALRAGLKLRRLPDYLDFIQNQTIGIASSNVFCGMVGTSTRQQLVVVGEALTTAHTAAHAASINPALRQQGSLLTDRYTRERVALNFLFGEEQQVEQPGKKFPLRMASLLAERSFVSALEQNLKEKSYQPYVGHTTELAQLEQLASEAMGGQTRAFLLTGTEGCGKSALLGEVSRRWLARAGTGAVGLYYQYGQVRPFLGWAGVLAWLCDFADSDTRMGRVAKINEVISRYAPDQLELVAPVQQLLNVTPYSHKLYADLVRPGRLRDQFFQLFVNLIEAKSASQPLLIELENLHWSDEASRELLAHLIGQLQSAVLFGLTANTTLAGLPSDIITLELGPLNHEECQRLIGQAGDKKLAADQTDKITKLAGGNPLQTMQVVRYWQQHRQLPTSLEEITLFSLTVS